MNVARIRAERPEMADFYAQVEAVYAVSDSSPGFVWRLTEESGEPQMLVNISVWESVEALTDFTYKSAHSGVLRDRARWFERPTKPHQVLWWVPVGHHPGYAEGWVKLKQLRAEGPGPEAFTFASVFAPPIG